MLLEDLNWMDVEEYLKHDDRIILVTGSCEQHGYLSLLADVREPMAIATPRRSEKTCSSRRRSTLACRRTLPRTPAPSA